MNGIVDTVVTVLLFFLILGTLVVIHELGHFVTARLANVRVLEFGIGFPPRARVLRSSGETLYTLNWLPIGGFVKLEGEDGDESGDPRSFANQSLPVRLLILAAGVLMNVLTAFVIFFLIALLAAPRVGLVIPQVQPDSPAASAGLRPGDAILSVNGERYDLFEPDPLIDIRSRAGETIVLGVQRSSGEREDIEVTLRSPEEVSANNGALGIAAPDGWTQIFLRETVGRDPVTALRIGAEQTGYWFGLILGGLGDLARSFISDPTAPPAGVSGPVGIATGIGDVFRNAGPIMTLYVAAILSANLALVNALPLPPLDGGRMLVITLKRIFGTRISLRAEQLTYFVGFAFLMAFLIWVTIFDVIRGGRPV
jgi:regulator of sigma E protease